MYNNLGLEIINDRDPNQRFGVVIAFAIMIAICESIAQCSMKHYSNTYPDGNKIFMGMGVVGYVAVSMLLLTSYKSEAMGHMNLVWSCVSIVVALSMGFLLFDEKINKYTVSAAGIALFAVYMAHLADEENNNVAMPDDANCNEHD